jgi:general secretion pathway protein G
MHYKDAADKGAFQTKVDSQNYPPDLETLVNGIDVQGKKLQVPPPHSDGPHDRQGRMGIALHAGRSGFNSYGGQSVFDVYSKSEGTALDGTKYSNVVGMKRN